MENVRRTVRKVQIIFGRNEAPCGSILRRLMTKFETISSVLTSKSPERKRSSRSEEQLVLVQDSVTVSPKKFNWPQLDIPTASLYRILRRITSIFVKCLNN